MTIHSIQTWAGLFLCGMVVGANLQILHMSFTQETHEDIVKHGAAHWQVNADGSTEFKWNGPEYVLKVEEK